MKYLLTLALLLLASCSPEVISFDVHQVNEINHGLCCQLYTQPMSNNYVANLYLNIVNITNKTISIPVYNSAEIVIPVVDFIIKEEPDVKTAHNRGWFEDVYNLEPGNCLTSRVSDLYHIGYGKHENSRWIYFVPEKVLYNIKAKVKLADGSIYSNIVYVQFKTNAQPTTTADGGE